MQSRHGAGAELVDVGGARSRCLQVGSATCLLAICCVPATTTPHTYAAVSDTGAGRQSRQRYFVSAPARGRPRCMMRAPPYDASPRRRRARARTSPRALGRASCVGVARRRAAEGWSERASTARDVDFHRGRAAWRARPRRSAERRRRRVSGLAAPARHTHVLRTHVTSPPRSCQAPCGVGCPPEEVRRRAGDHWRLRPQKVRAALGGARGVERPRVRRVVPPRAVAHRHLRVRTTARCEADPP